MRVGRPWRGLVVLGVAVATFLPALHNGLLGDDGLLLEERVDPSRAPAIPEFFRQSYWGDLHDDGLYRPLSLALLTVERRAFGTRPAPYRLVNLVLHALCSMLVLLLLGRLLPSGAAFAGALLFAAHPIHAEAVATIYGQQDLLAALFFLAAALVSLKSGAHGASGAWTAVAGALYLLSLLSKEQGVLLPALLPVLRLVQSGSGPSRLAPRDFAMIVPFVTYLLLRVQAVGLDAFPTGSASVAYGYPWWARINLVIVALGTYLRLLVVPWWQTTYYGHLRDSLFGSPVPELITLIVAIMLFKPLQRALGGIVLQAYAFLAATLLPVANMLPIGVVVGERCLYLPVFAVCLLAGAAYLRGARARPYAAAAAFCAVVVAGMILSARVADRWRTPLMHYQTTADDHPRSAGAHARFALLLLQEAALDEAPPDPAVLERAETAIERALRINERLPEAWHARGRLALLRGDCAAAVPAFERALALRPGDMQVLRLLGRCR